MGADIAGIRAGRLLYGRVMAGLWALYHHAIIMAVYSTDDGAGGARGIYNGGAGAGYNRGITGARGAILAFYTFWGLTIILLWHIMGAYL